jgi:hypothetical protein
MAEHQIGLQRLQVLAGDAGVGQESEAGVDAIDGLSGGDDPGDGAGPRLDRVEGFRRDLDH